MLASFRFLFYFCVCCTHKKNSYFDVDRHVNRSFSNVNLGDSFFLFTNKDILFAIRFGLRCAKLVSFIFFLVKLAIFCQSIQQIWSIRFRLLDCNLRFQTTNLFRQFLQRCLWFDFGNLCLQNFYICLPYKHSLKIEAKPHIQQTNIKIYKSKFGQRQ